MIEHPSCGTPFWYIDNDMVMQGKMQCMSGDRYYLASSPFDRDGDWRLPKDVWATRREAVAACEADLLKRIDARNELISNQASIVAYLESSLAKAREQLEQYKAERDGLSERFAALHDRPRGN